MLSKQLQKQIEQDANKAYNLIRDVGKKIGYKKGATVYAEKWQASEQEVKRLEQWKKEASELLDPILDWGQSEKDLPLGTSITEEVLRRAKAFKELEQRIEKLEKALKEIKEMAVYPKTENESGVARYKILKCCEEILTPKT